MTSEEPASVASQQNVMEQHDLRIDLRRLAPTDGDVNNGAIMAASHVASALRLDGDVVPTKDESANSSGEPPRLNAVIGLSQRASGLE